MTREFHATGEVHIWDADLPPSDDSLTILWRQSADAGRPNTYSISKLVEQDADIFRQRYLGWIYQLGETNFNGKKVVEHLLLRDGLSYWWMGALAQKFNLSEHSGIHDALKAMALEKWIDQQNIRHLTLFTENDHLDECLGRMCLKKGIQYRRESAGNSDHKQGKFSFYRKLPFFFQAMIYYFWYLLKAVPLLFSWKRPDSFHSGEVMLIDILIHLDKGALSRGKFASNYWADLVEKLNKWKIKCTWLHLFYRHSDIPDFDSAQHKINLFNQNAEHTQFHRLLESAISFRIFWRGLFDYLKLRKGVSAVKELNKIDLENSDLNLWSLHASEWKNSVSGGEAIINCLRLSLFEKVLGNIPVQKLGIYVAENQPWEIALLHAWKVSGHNTIIGMPHTTVRFWDLRYHHDSRCYSEKNDIFRIPCPDLLAVNGPAAKKSLIVSGYPTEHLVGVEALRFRHLDSDAIKTVPQSGSQRPFTVLICGDFLTKTNRKMLRWISEAARQLPADIHYILKPHPAFPVHNADIPNMNLSVSDLSIADLLRQSDAAFASDTTSAAVDAYCSGVPVIIMWDGGNFNFSPLRDFDEVNYAGNATELGSILKKISHNNELKIQGNGLKTQDFFYTGRKLMRWKKLMGTYISGYDDE